jgi:hypothetical protein
MNLRKLFDSIDVFFDDILCTFDGLYEAVVTEGFARVPKKPRERYKKFVKYFRLNGDKLKLFRNDYQLLGLVKQLKVLTYNFVGTSISFFKTVTKIEGFLNVLFQMSLFISGIYVTQLFFNNKLFGNLKSLLNSSSLILGKKQFEIKNKTLVQGVLKNFLEQTVQIKSTKKIPLDNKTEIFGTRDIESLLEILD